MTGSAVDLRHRLAEEGRSLGVGRDRAVPPVATCARWSPDTLWERFGVTRVGRITGLDRLGVPVWASVRPNARTLSVCQGKGMTDDAARASALMEAVEVATGERHDHPIVEATRRDLLRAGNRVDRLTSLLRRGAKPPGDDERCGWLPASDLINGESVLLPSEAILLDDTRPAIYWRSTDGLASGNVMAEAVTHALCERIERDAMRLWAFAPEQAVRRAAVAAETLDDAGLSSLVARIEEAGMTLRLFDIATDIRVPVYFAVIFPDRTGFDLAYLDVTSGSGCHPWAARAAIRAVTEAVQSRLTKIAASRDDFDPALYEAKLPEAIMFYRECVPASAGAPRDTAPVTTPNVTAVIDALSSARIRDVWVVVLADEPGLAVVRAVLPQLENPPGERAAIGGVRLARRLADLS